MCELCHFNSSDFPALCENDNNSVISDEIQMTNVKNQLLQTTYSIIAF